jgi:hypothetical protein
MVVSTAYVNILQGTSGEGAVYMAGHTRYILHTQCNYSLWSCRCCDSLLDFLQELQSSLQSTAVACCVMTLLCSINTLAIYVGTNCSAVVTLTYLLTCDV